MPSDPRDTAIAAAREMAIAFGQTVHASLAGLLTYRDDPADTDYQKGYRDALVVMIEQHLAPLVPLHDRLREALERL